MYSNVCLSTLEIHTSSEYELVKIDYINYFKDKI